MKVSKLTQFEKGWFIGNFEPSCFKTNMVEVAIKKYNAGAIETEHFHKIATEFTVIIEGKAEMNGVIYEANDIIRIEPNTSTKFTALTDLITVVVKLPCVKSDKYIK